MANNAWLNSTLPFIPVIAGGVKYMIKICVYQPELVFPPTFAGQILTATGGEMSFIYGHCVTDYCKLKGRYFILTSNIKADFFYFIIPVDWIHRHHVDFYSKLGVLQKKHHTKDQIP